VQIIVVLQMGFQVAPALIPHYKKILAISALSIMPLPKRSRDERGTQCNSLQTQGRKNYGCFLGSANPDDNIF